MPSKELQQGHKWWQSVRLAELMAVRTWFWPTDKVGLALLFTKVFLPKTSAGSLIALVSVTEYYAPSISSQIGVISVLQQVGPRGVIWYFTNYLSKAIFISRWIYSAGGVAFELDIIYATPWRQNNGLAIISMCLLHCQKIVQETT